MQINAQLSALLASLGLTLQYRMALIAQTTKSLGRGPSTQVPVRLKCQAIRGDKHMVGRKDADLGLNEDTTHESTRTRQAGHRL